MKPWQFFSATCMLFISGLSFAGDVYVCEKNGRKEFSQLPCGDKAVVLQTNGEPSTVKVSIPLVAKEVTSVCKLAIKSKDRAAQKQKIANQAYVQNYRYNSQNYRYQQHQYHNYDSDYNQTNRDRDDPQRYFLSKIENLEMVAKNSPLIYRMLKELVYTINYQGYEESPIYEAERAAALASCQDILNNNMDYLRSNSYYN